jgi:signal transduction histidine kinase
MSDVDPPRRNTLTLERRKDDLPAPSSRPPKAAWFGANPAARSNECTLETARIKRRHISHDINHEISTIMLLALLLANAPDVGPDSRERARLILGETRWLDQLHRAYEGVVDHDEPWDPPSEPIRLDLLAEEVVSAMRMSTLAKVRLSTKAVRAHADRLAFWRSLRNVIDNAIRAAGPDGHVDVRVTEENGWAVAEVDDDGPGFESAPARRLTGGVSRTPLGLAIVADMVAACGGTLEIRTGYLGGSCVRLQVPAAGS